MFPPESHYRPPRGCVGERRRKNEKCAERVQNRDAVGYVEESARACGAVGEARRVVGEVLGREGHRGSAVTCRRRGSVPGRCRDRGVCTEHVQRVGSKKLQ